MSSLIKNIIIFLGLILTFVTGYYLFVINKDTTLAVTDSLLANQVDIETQSFLSRLEELKTIDLSKDILRDPRMTGLVDSSTQINPLPVGRDNPFAPVN